MRPQPLATTYPYDIADAPSYAHRNYPASLRNSAPERSILADVLARGLANSVEDTRQCSRQCLADALEAAAPAFLSVNPDHAAEVTQVAGGVSGTREPNIL